MAKSLRVVIVGAIAVACFWVGGAQVGASSPPPSGSFESRWSKPLEGELIALESTADRVYAAMQNGSDVEVIAFDLDEGEVWRRPVTDTFTGEFWSRAVDRGFLITFDDAAGGHLMLLNADDGETAWDRPLDFSAYDIGNQLTPDVGLIWIRERDLEFVDLDTGDRAPAGRYEFDPSWKVVGNQLARFDGESLEVGSDPFDSSARTEIIELPATASDVTASSDGRLIIATVGSELVGMIEGEEAWRWTPEVPEISDVEVFDNDYIGVAVDAGSDLWAQFAQVGDDVVEPFGTLPENFVLSDFWKPNDGEPVLVGYFDDTPDLGEGNPLPVATIQLREGLPVHQVPDATRGSVGAFGDYVFSSGEEQINIFKGVELEPVTSLRRPDYSRQADLHNGIVVYDIEQSAITAYA
jgi:hypothetical protein